MLHKWPGFEFRPLPNGLVSWSGTLVPMQKPYLIQVIWKPGTEHKPYVMLKTPELAPRAGSTFDAIPHLIFNAEQPAASGLCLFDPDGEEWSNRRLIADTTLPWTCEWLYHYEFWLADGVWRGASVGYESVAEARAATVYRQASELAEDKA